jgi:hypothetical protein
MMHGPEKSDPAIVAMKPANKAEQSAAESVERRAGTKGNADQQSTYRTQSRANVSQALERIRRWPATASPSHTQGGSRMRESRTYGSVRGACDETHVPTATPADEPLMARTRSVSMSALSPLLEHKRT